MARFSKLFGYAKPFSGPVQTYSNSFDSATFAFWIQKFSRPHVIGFVADLLFSTLEGGLKKYPQSPAASGRKPYPERKSCGLKNIWIYVDGALVNRYLKAEKCIRLKLLVWKKLLFVLVYVHKAALWSEGWRFCYGSLGVKTFQGVRETGPSSWVA